MPKLAKGRHFAGENRFSGLSWPEDPLSFQLLTDFIKLGGAVRTPKLLLSRHLIFYLSLESPEPPSPLRKNSNLKGTALQQEPIKPRDLRLAARVL